MRRWTIGWLRFLPLGLLLALPVEADRRHDTASKPCGEDGQVFFHCRLTHGDDVTVCGFPGEHQDKLHLQVDQSRGGEPVWRWPETSSETEQAPVLFFERQTHVRSVSYHLWFERAGEVVDLVDHWTEGSRDSHFAGLIMHGAGAEGRRTLSCHGDPSVLLLKDLADQLPHRAVPVP